MVINFNWVIRTLSVNNDSKGIYLKDLLICIDLGIEVIIFTLRYNSAITYLLRTEIEKKHGYSRNNL